MTSDPASRVRSSSSDDGVLTFVKALLASCLSPVVLLLSLAVYGAYRHGWRSTRILLEGMFHPLGIILFIVPSVLLGVVLMILAERMRLPRLLGILLNVTVWSGVILLIWSPAER